MERFLERLEQWREPMGLSPQDLYFADLIGRLAERPGAEVVAAAALCSRATGDGHLCLELEQVAGRRYGDLRLPPRATWRRQLLESGVVGRPGDFRPLVLDAADRLYLYRYWEYESRLAEALGRRAAEPPVMPGPASRELLQRLFPSSGGETDWQKLAAATAQCRNLTVISGGPGTGKTTTVVRILALLLAAAPDLRVALAAPTGKAAGRLEESVRMARETLPLEAAEREAIPHRASTLHRLLGATPAGGFRYHGANLLPLDLLILDEASMVDVAMMARLLQALPQRARLILLGDRFQLSSVESGAVLGDLCAGADGFTPPFREMLETVTGEPAPLSSMPRPAAMADSVVYLRRSYRFAGDSGIGRLADAVRRGEPEGCLRLLREGGRGDIGGIAVDDLREQAVAGYRDYLERAGSGDDPAAVFDAFSRFRVLAALRHGRQGVEGLNRWLERALVEAGLLPAPEGWYPGRPVMILQNDYDLQLYNGDIGILLGDGARGVRAWFPDPDGGMRAVAPARLPAHESAFAMTVHKSQGSEFDQVLLVLPERDHPLLTRELLYTAVTRARRRFLVCAPDDVLAAAVSRPTRRSSGLREALWGRGASTDP